MPDHIRYIHMTNAAPVTGSCLTIALLHYKHSDSQTVSHTFSGFFANLHQAKHCKIVLPSLNQEYSFKLAEHLQLSGYCFINCGNRQAAQFLRMFVCPSQA